MQSSADQENAGGEGKWRASPGHAVPWVARSESRRITAHLIEMLQSEPGRARAYFDALCLEGKADSYHYSVMMEASPDVAGAQALLDQMQSEGLTPQTTSMNVLLKKMCLDGNMEAAETLLEDMQEGDVPPDERSYTQLICGYSDRGNAELADRLFKRMQEAGFARHVQSWEDLVNNLKLKVNTATLASMLSKGDDDRAQAVSFYEGLVASNATDVVLFNIMLNATRTVSEARNIWRDMASANLAPSTTSYNTLLRVLCENECIEEAMQVVQQAEAASLADERTYTRIIYHLHHRGQVRDATHLFERCQQQLSMDSAKDARKWGGQVSPIARGGTTQPSTGSGPEQAEAEPPYMELVRRVASSERTKELDRMLKAGRLEEAWLLFRSWTATGEADTYTYNTIMHGCGSASQALTLKANMTANGIPVSESTWNILLQLLSMEGRVAEGRALLDEMEDSGITPTERTLRPLLKTMRACGQQRDARRLSLRCKLERSVKEKEELARGAAQGLIPDEGLSDVERKDAAAAAVASEIAQRHVQISSRDNADAKASLTPPPGGWGKFAGRKTSEERGNRKGRGTARGRGSGDRD